MPNFLIHFPAQDNYVPIQFKRMRVDPGDSLASAIETITSIFNVFEDSDFLDSLLADIDSKDITLNPSFMRENVDAWLPDVEEYIQEYDGLALEEIGPGQHFHRMMRGMAYNPAGISTDWVCKLVADLPPARS